MTTETTNDYEIIISIEDMFNLIRPQLYKAESKYSAQEYFDSREAIDRALHLLNVVKKKLYSLDEVTRATLRGGKRLNINI